MIFRNIMANFLLSNYYNKLFFGFLKEMQTINQDLTGKLK